MIVGDLAILAFAAAQGAVVFATAYVVLRFARTAHPLAKLMAMPLSLAAWLAMTIGAYVLMGGEGGLMDGLGMLLFLCFTATVSSGVYLVGWLLAPLWSRRVGPLP